jgi:hypothetical protein
LETTIFTFSSIPHPYSKWWLYSWILVDHNPRYKKGRDSLTKVVELFTFVGSLLNRHWLLKKIFSDILLGVRPHGIWSKCWSKQILIKIPLPLVMVDELNAPRCGFKPLYSSLNMDTKMQIAFVLGKIFKPGE